MGWIVSLLSFADRVMSVIFPWWSAKEGARKEYETRIEDSFRKTPDTVLLRDDSEEQRKRITEGAETAKK